MGRGSRGSGWVGSGGGGGGVRLGGGLRVDVNEEVFVKIQSKKSGGGVGGRVRGGSQWI